MKLYATIELGHLMTQASHSTLSMKVIYKINVLVTFQNFIVFIWSEGWGVRDVGQGRNVCTAVEIGEQPVEVDFLLPPCRSWGLNSSCHAWWQAPILTVTPRQPPKSVIFMKIYYKYKQESKSRHFKSQPWHSVSHQQ